MNKESKIYVAGHRGLVGSALVRNLEKKGYKNVLGRSRDELNLIDPIAVSEFFTNQKPDYVFLAAAKVGGIIANNNYRGEFIFENLQIQNNVIHHAYLNGVKKLLFLGSSCIYPKSCPQPIQEDYLLTDILEYTNEPYAIAKIAGIKLCESYNMQYGTNFISVMPTNLYGPNDNYDLEKSHVLPALIRKMHLGKCLMNNDWQSIRLDLNYLPIEGVGAKATENDILEKLMKFGVIKTDSGVSVLLWGTGSPKREFLHSDDMADACVYIMENIDFKDLIDIRKKYSDETLKIELRNTHINIGVGKDISIKELACVVKEVVEFKGGIEWDSSKPDGTMRKLLNVDKLRDLGWKEKLSLKDGINQVYLDYITKAKH